MITGFNTDIQHGGVTYHVQTEDKGLETPLILSLVYVGGAIIASKRTYYDDLIQAGFDENALTERLQRQHKLICAAINSGRVEDLKRMGARAETTRPEPAASEELPVAKVEFVETQAAPVLLTGGEQFQDDSYLRETPWTGSLNNVTSEITSEPALPLPPAPAQVEAEPLQVEAETLEIVEGDDADEIYLTILEDEGEFRAGQLATIKIQVGRGQYGQKPVADALVSIKVLGTTFRPLILSTRTNSEGVAVVRALLPRFTSGRAAIIIRASEGEDFSEMRRIIHQA